MKANCFNCMYGGSYNPIKKIASCECENIVEKTIVEYDKVLKKNRIFVQRKDIDQETDCPNFIPDLSENSGSYILEEDCSFIAHFDCPFCGEEIEEYGLGVEETRVIECDCGHKLYIHGKQI